MDKGVATAIGREAAEKVRATVTSPEFAQKAKDAAFTLVGLGVMGAQRATAATKQAVSRFGSDDGAIRVDLEGLRLRTVDLAASIREQLGSADELLEGALARIEDAFAPLEERLPSQARETVNKVRGAGRELHAQVRTLVVKSDDTDAGDDVSAED